GGSRFTFTGLTDIFNLSSIPDMYDTRAGIPPGAASFGRPKLIERRVPLSAALRRSAPEGSCSGGCRER
ncbi:MAG: hypothetical protein JXR32_09970, partial [Anaerolineaceae bacterium]|nr:hypothetical protein [Anaerolineaceae bacterium]